jgi:hypothetical protein
MRPLYKMRAAAIVGAIVEFILYAPLLLLAHSHVDTTPFRLCVDVLDVLQTPGVPLVLRLLHIQSVRQFAARYRAAHGVLLTAEVLVFVIQATIFALVALGVIYILRSSKARGSLLNLLRTRLLVPLFAPPLFILAITGPVMLPSYLVSEDEAKVLLTASSIWLVLATLVVGTAMIAKAKRAQLLT